MLLSAFLAKDWPLIMAAISFIEKSIYSCHIGFNTMSDAICSSPYSQFTAQASRKRSMTLTTIKDQMTFIGRQRPFNKLSYHLWLACNATQYFSNTLLSTYFIYVGKFFHLNLPLLKSEYSVCVCVCVCVLRYSLRKANIHDGQNDSSC